MSDLPRLGSAAFVSYWPLDSLSSAILMVQRSKQDAYGKWVLPGGKVRPFEALADAAEREVLEETGLPVKVQRLETVFELVVPDVDHRVVALHTASFGGEPMPLVPGDDVSDARWVPLFALKDYPLTELTLRMLRWFGVSPG